MKKARLTKAQREARDAVRKWWTKHRKSYPVQDIRHVHAHAYVVGYAAPGCLVVACDGMESEPHMREWTAKSPLSTVHQFEDGIKPGEWVYFAYVATQSSSEHCAVRRPDMKSEGHSK